MKIPKGGNQNPYIEEEQTTQWTKILRYQRGNQNPYIEEEKTTVGKSLKIPKELSESVY